MSNNLAGLDPAALFERALEPPRARRTAWILAPLILLPALALILLPEKTPPAAPPTISAPAEKSPAAPPAPAKRPVAEIQAAAAAGDIDSKIELGLLHLEGIGVPRDKGAAARLLTEAAKAGSARADGLLQLRMQIQSLDFKRVHDYWLPLAEAGDAKIMSALGELYMRGRGVAHDPHQAVHWFERAIAAGYLPAHLHLVKMYTGNRGLPPDPVKKIHHLRKGVEAGRWDAMVDLANHLIEGRHVTKNAEEAFALAIRCAEEGGEEARRIIGKLYAEGLGVSKSLPDAVYWLRIATDDGDHRAEIMLDGILKTGCLPPSDRFPRNFAEILKLAESGRPAACYEAGVFYIRGQGTPRNETEGARWILRAAELGVARAQWHIADILEAGRYVPRDPEAAARWREIHRATLADLPHIPANDSETLFLANSDPSVP